MLQFSTPCDRILRILLHVVDTWKPYKTVTIWPYGYHMVTVWLPYRKPGVEMFSVSHLFHRSIVPGPGSPRALPTTRRCEGSQSSRWEQRPRRCSNMFEHWIYCITLTRITVLYYTILYPFILHHTLHNLVFFHVVSYHTCSTLHDCIHYIVFYSMISYDLYHIIWHCSILYCMKTYYVIWYWNMISCHILL